MHPQVPRGPWELRPACQVYERTVGPPCVQKYPPLCHSRPTAHILRLACCARERQLQRVTNQVGCQNWNGCKHFNLAKCFYRFVYFVGCQNCATAVIINHVDNSWDFSGCRNCATAVIINHVQVNVRNCVLIQIFVWVTSFWQSLGCNLGRVVKSSVLLQVPTFCFWSGFQSWCPRCPRWPRWGLPSVCTPLFQLFLYVNKVLCACTSYYGAKSHTRIASMMDIYMARW